MSTQRLQDILDEVVTLEAQRDALLAEAVALSGRTRGDKLRHLNIDGQIIRVEAKVAMPFVNSVRTNVLSVYITWSPYTLHKDGRLSKRVATIIEPLAKEWARVRVKAGPRIAETNASSAVDFTNRMADRRKAERRGPADRCATCGLSRHDQHLCTTCEMQPADTVEEVAQFQMRAVPPAPEPPPTRHMRDDRPPPPMAYIQCSSCGIMHSGVLGEVCPNCVVRSKIVHIP